MNLWKKTPASRTSSGGSSERPEAVPIPVEEREAIHLRERPEEAREHNQRPDRRDGDKAARAGRA
jgi:hypothetical protein